VILATAGELYLDGAKQVDLPAAAEARLDNVEVGDRSVEIRYASGDKETKSVGVQKGQSSNLSFSWKKAQVAPVPPATIAPAGMVFVPGGSFTMGSIDGESDERPRHQVTLSDFYIGSTEVTQAQYRAVMGTNPSSFISDSDDLPVERVSWYDAVAYCNKCSIIEGLHPAYTIDGTNVSWDRSANGYRLPTEAEWEYSAKGGAAPGLSAVNAVYAGSPNIDEVGWYSGNSGNRTHPVGLKAPNALGLYDMSGNVWKWCWDWYGSYSSGNQRDPTGPSSGSYRVMRGGSWFNDASYAAVSYRGSIIPCNSDGYGFRVVRSSP
jgi:formylglycine-generating enzyme